MKKLTLARSYLNDRTIGYLKYYDEKLATLERPWRNNKINESCIPEGVYLVKRDKAGRFKYYAVQDVQGRSNIEFHAGNTVKDSQGCILVGISHNREGDLINSKKGINSLLETIGDNDFILHIRAATKDDF